MKHALSLKFREVVLFVLVSLALSVGVYREALWGGAMLAPLDLGPAFFQNYKFMDPEAGQVPENHYIIDQLTYDLPLQKIIYDSYRAGEIPWWDPYTYGGRPLLADAHINGTDPVRLSCYAFLPFEWAYNWNYALRGIITGLGMFLLLRYFKIDPLASIIFALTYQFGGWFTMFFGHPWIQASFMYYPFLWLVWLKGMQSGIGRHDAVAGILCSLIFWSGNLQSHTYLPLFAACFLAGLVFKNRQLWWRGLQMTAISGIIGALLAIPVLANQLEFFLLSTRSIESSSLRWLNPYSIPTSLCSIHPWILGSFKTLDAGKMFGSGGNAFFLFCGGTITVLAILGGWALRRSKGLIGSAVAQSFLIVVLYFVVISTPLTTILYPRMAGMPGMAIILLGGLGWKQWASSAELLPRHIARWCLAIFCAGLVFSTIAVVVGFPHIRPKIEAKISAIGPEGTSGLATTALRDTQITRLPTEITLLNPEALVGFTAVLLLLAAFSLSHSKHQKKLMFGALMLGALTSISFHHRFRPKHDIALWNRLAEGGVAQNETIKALRGGLRFNEAATPSAKQIFPFAMAPLYRVHMVHGYSALQPKSIINLRESKNLTGFENTSDFSFDSTATQNQSGNLNPSRFCALPSGDSISSTILAESLNSLSVRVASSSENNKIVRTDTFYPGWSLLEAPDFIPERFGYCFSSWPVPSTSNPAMTFSYRPSTYSLWPWCFALAAFLLIALFWKEFKKSHR